MGKLPEDRWSQRSHSEPCSQGCKVYLTTLSDNDQRLLAATGRSRKQQPDRLLAGISPRMRYASLHLYSLTCRSFDRLFTQNKPGRTFQHQKVLVFPLMNMQRGAVSGVSNDLHHGVSPIGSCCGHPNAETLTRPRRQPFRAVGSGRFRDDIDRTTLIRQKYTCLFVKCDPARKRAQSLPSLATPAAEVVTRLSFVAAI